MNRHHIMIFLSILIVSSSKPFAFPAESESKEGKAWYDKKPKPGSVESRTKSHGVIVDQKNLEGHELVMSLYQKSSQELSDLTYFRKRKVVSTAINLLNDHQYADRATAAFLLGKMGESARKAVPALKSAGDDKKNIGLSNSAVDALVKIGPAEDVLPFLMTKVKAGDRHLATIEALGGFKEKSLPALPLLLNILNENPHPDTLNSIGKAIEQIGSSASDPVLSTLVQKLQDTDCYSCGTLIRVLPRVEREKAKKYVPALNDLVSNGRANCGYAREVLDRLDEQLPHNADESCPKETID